MISRYLILLMSFCFSASAVKAQEAPKTKSEEAKPEETKGPLVGEWELVLIGDKTVKDRTIFEFAKDGKLHIKLRSSAMQSAYAMAGGRLTLTRSVDGKPVAETFKIETLTADQLVVVSESGCKMQFEHCAVTAPPTDLTDRPEGPEMHVAPADRDSFTKLVGLWEIAGQTGVTVRFLRDGRFRLSTGRTGMVEGTFKLAGNQITLTFKSLKGKESADTLTIKTLSAEQMVTVDSKGKEQLLKRSN